MKLKVIKNKTDYQRALKRLEKIFDAAVNTAVGDEAEMLTILIDTYENEHYPIETPDPIEAIKFRMDQMNLSRTDIAKIIGYRSRTTEILTKKRKLNLAMIRNLQDKLRIPYESLMAAY
jgi:HTH-type transcriptional regulator / antitoxin HigA